MLETSTPNPTIAAGVMGQSYVESTWHDLRWNSSVSLAKGAGQKKQGSLCDISGVIQSSGTPNDFGLTPMFFLRYHDSTICPLCRGTGLGSVATLARLWFWNPAWKTGKDLNAEGLGDIGSHYSQFCNYFSQFWFAVAGICILFLEIFGKFSTTELIQYFFPGEATMAWMIFVFFRGGSNWIISWSWKNFNFAMLLMEGPQLGRTSLKWMSLGDLNAWMEFGDGESRGSSFFEFRFFWKWRWFSEWLLAVVDDDNDDSGVSCTW